MNSIVLLLAAAVMLSLGFYLMAILVDDRPPKCRECNRNLRVGEVDFCSDCF